MSLSTRLAALERARADDRAGRVVVYSPWEAPPAGAIRLEWGDGPVVFLPDNGRGDLNAELRDAPMLAWLLGERLEERELYPLAWAAHLQLDRALFAKPAGAERTPVAPAPVAEPAPADEVLVEPGPRPPPTRPWSSSAAAAPRESTRALEDALDRAFSPRW